MLQIKNINYKLQFILILINLTNIFSYISLNKNIIHVNKYNAFAMKKQNDIDHQLNNDKDKSTIVSFTKKFLASNLIMISLLTQSPMISNSADNVISTNTLEKTIISLEQSR